jgi:hypothetical protein
VFSFIKRIPGVFALYLLIGLARVSQTLDKLPADPGFDRLREVRTDGIRGVFSQSLGYLDISAHIGPLVTTAFGLQYSAIILTLTTVFFTALLALLIYCAVHAEIGSRLVAVICGALLMLVPAAAESTLGNHGSLKWSLMAVLCVVISAREFRNRYVGVVLVLIFFTGLSNPFTFVVLSGLVSQILRKRRVELRIEWLIISCTILTTLLQFVVWYSSGISSHIYESVKLIPWNGMGFFWWWIWCSPVVMSTAVILSLAKFLRKRTDELVYAGWLALSALVLWLLMYWEAGIKDSTAVATCSLSSIALLIAVHSLKPMKIQRLLLVGAIGSFALLSIPWFSAGWYLTDTPNWSSEIARLQSDCEHLGVQRGEVLIQTTHIEFTCDEISKWG